MKKTRSVNSPLDWRDGKNDGQFVRIRIARSADIVQQKWQNKTEIEPPLLFLSQETWLCDWSDGDFENGKFSIDDSGNGENYTLSLKFLSKLAPADFQIWWGETLRKQQVCVELTDANDNERVFNPFDVSYKYDESSSNGEMTAYELIFVRSKVFELKDRIVSVVTDCESGITKFVFASGKPELYIIAAENEAGTVIEAGEIGFNNLSDGKYKGHARLKIDRPGSIKTEFIVKCSTCTLTINEVVEIFDCTLSITDIEEITGLAENEGTIVIGINS